MSHAVCLLGFGEVGQALVETMSSRVDRLCAWDLKFSDPDSPPSRAAAKLGVRGSSDAAGAARDADVIICAVTATQIEPAVRSVAPHVMRNAWYFDLNSTSPQAKAAAARIADEAGARFVEAAIMSPIAPRGAASPMLIGGDHAAEFQRVATQLGFTSIRVMPGRLGSASAAKMCRSVIVKGLEALVLESLLSARRHGVEDVVLESLRGLKIDDWREGARYMASRALLHGTRRAEEMREVSRTVGEAGVVPRMSEACAAWQEWAGTHARFSGEPLPQLLDGLLAALPAREGP
jgi:3-hydroxyisobutyrate dehydrogenase-like beta-hydroxyacid dehydrogenase